MDAADAAKGANKADKAARADHSDFGFLPENLLAQCRSLIEGYHELHGYQRLPDILWKAGLGPFIETHHEFRHLLKKASTTRSAKKSNEGFAQIAAALLSLEILTSHFAGWAAIYPRAAAKAQVVLKHYTRGPHTPLMESYLYPPKQISSAAIAALAPPTKHDGADSAAYGAPGLPRAASQWSDDTLAITASSFST